MVKPLKELGQNFLKDETTARSLVEAGGVSEKDIVLEIGPGKGFVSQEIAKKAGELIAVELDPRLLPILEKNLASYKNIKIINSDALKFLNDIKNIQNKKFNKIVASIPFQITSPLLHQIVLLENKLDLATLLIQKEVAERVTAQPPNANYMSTFLQTFYEIKIVNVIPRTSFSPEPQVDGAIIKMVSIKNARSDTEIKTEEVEKYSKFLHHGFLQQRKMLNKRFPAEILNNLGIDPSRRAESLTLKEWIKLYRATQLQTGKSVII